MIILPMYLGVLRIQEQSLWLKQLAEALRLDDEVLVAVPASSPIPLCSGKRPAYPIWLR